MHFCMYKYITIYIFYIYGPQQFCLDVPIIFTFPFLCLRAKGVTPGNISIHYLFSNFSSYTSWVHMRSLSCCAKERILICGSKGQKFRVIINKCWRKNIMLAHWLMSQQIELASTKTPQRKVIKLLQLELRKEMNKALGLYFSK